MAKTPDYRSERDAPHPDRDPFRRILRSPPNARLPPPPDAVAVLVDGPFVLVTMAYANDADLLAAAAFFDRAGIPVGVGRP